MLFKAFLAASCSVLMLAGQGAAITAVTLSSKSDDLHTLLALADEFNVTLGATTFFTNDFTKVNFVGTIQPVSN